MRKIKWRNGAQAICHSGHDHVIVGKYGVLEAQLGLLQVAEGLVENNGKANPTDTELSAKFFCQFLRSSAGSVF